MNKRIALKVLKNDEKFWSISVRYKRKTLEKARAIGRRNFLDQRFPYIETEEELEERSNWVLSILTDCLLPEDLADKLKEELW